MNKISWTDGTWNPVHGCTKISAGCKNCYAERMSKRLAGRHGYPAAPDNFKVTLRPDRLEQPLKWRKPKRIFVCSMSDLFHEDVPFAYIAKVFSIIKKAHQHTFQILTKRPERLVEFSVWNNEPPPENAWFGVTVETQKQAWRIDELERLIFPGKFFLSLEPLLGNIYIRPNIDRVQWVITGGETGPGARPSPPGGFESLRDQCLAAQVPFHFKGHGEWIDYQQASALGCRTVSGDRGLLSGGRFDGKSFPLQYMGQVPMLRVGNKRAGYLLDGVEHREMPEGTK